MPGNTKDAKTRLTDNSWREDISGYVLLGGLLLETLVLFVFSHGKDQIEIWLEAVAYFAVFGGVFGEIFFASKAREASEELSRQAELQIAEANRQAAEARLETERLKAKFAWRTIDSSSAEQILSVLAASPGQVFIEYAANDAETEHFAVQISLIFDRAKWGVEAKPVTVQGMAFWGLFVPDQNCASTQVIRAAFRAATLGFSEEAIEGRRTSLTGAGLSFGVAPKPGCALVTIGPKRPA